MFAMAVHWCLSIHCTRLITALYDSWLWCHLIWFSWRSYSAALWDVQGTTKYCLFVCLWSLLRPYVHVICFPASLPVKV